MSLIKLQGNASGTGALTIAAPNTNTDRTLTLPDTTGTIVMNEGSGIFKIDSSGNVGIGTNAPVSALHLASTAGPFITFQDNDAGANQPSIGTEGTAGSLIYSTGGTSASHIFELNRGASEAARIDSSGNLLVGKTASDVATVGAEIRANGVIIGTVNGSAAAFFNRTTSDGPLVSFRKDNTTLGSIEAFNGALTIAGITATGPQVKIMNNTTSVLTLGAYGSASQYGYIGDESGGAVGVAFVNVGLVPVTANNGALADNTFNIGAATGRWDNIYATNNVIQTSDRNEKQDIEELDDAERRVAVACKSLLRKYRWKDAVVKKGDDARIHFGIIAQDLQDAFSAEGLDAGRYGMFINSTWTDEKTGEERSRMGVRYPELLAFMIAVL